MFLLAEMLVIILLVPYDWLYKASDIEYQWLAATYSAETMHWLITKANAWHYILTRESGIADALQWYFIPQDPGLGLDGMGQRVWFPYIESRGKVLDEMVIVMLTRLINIGIWMPLIVLIIIGVSFDAAMERRIKQHTFKYPSPFLYRYGAKASFLSVAFFLFALFSPLPIPTLGIPLLIMFGIAVTGLVVIANAPKRL